MVLLFLLKGLGGIFWLGEFKMEEPVQEIIQQPIIAEKKKSKGWILLIFILIIFGLVILAIF